MQKQASFKEDKARLYLVSSPIGNLKDISLRAIEVLKMVDYIACEDSRVSIKLLRHYDIKNKIILLHDFNEEKMASEILSLLKKGKNIAIISDAGYPLISDPGFKVVEKVIENDFPVITIGGSSALLNSLVSSGLPPSRFLFYGFLNPRKTKSKKELEGLKNIPYTLIFYEAPHRLSQTLKLIYELLGDRRIVVSRELTKINEEFLRGKTSEFLNLEKQKGEIVIIVEGKTFEDAIDYQKLLKKAKALNKNGLSKKEAIREIAKNQKINKNYLYKLLLKD